jgi:LacI family transcriptional regulator
MPAATKIAFVSPVWTTWQHRLMAGALRYVDSHPRLILRGFAPVKDLAATARELEDWGAQGVLGVLELDDLQKFLGALNRPIPIVNNALTRELPGVVTVVADFSAFVETAVSHLRQLGLRSICMLALEDNPHIREHLLGAFQRITKPQDPARATLLCTVDREQLWNPHAPVNPVPEPIVKWLKELPKPVGVLCPELGGGGYLIRCCQAIGLRVPEDIAVVGGDETDLSLTGEPTLTSVVPAVETMGVEATRLLVERINGAPHTASLIRLRCTDLQVRESTGKRRPEICDIAAAVQCIRENACRGITVEQVIKLTQRVSKVTFHRRFQEVIGKSPAEAIRERKLDEVRRLLTATELPLGIISDLSGFSSPKVLARAFRTEEGSTLRDYRKAHKGHKNGHNGHGSWRTS